MRVLALAVLAALVSWSAHAQQQSQVYFDSGSTPRVVPVTPTNPLPVTGSASSTSVSIGPSASAAVALTPVVSASAEATHVLKNAAGNLYSAYATNLTGTAGFLAIVNATSAPADGAITPLACAPLPANGAASINYAPGPPARYSTGITAVITSAVTCFTLTTGVITGYIGAAVD